MFRRLAIIAATMLALTMLLAACGEEDVDPTAANGSGSPADPTATVPPTETPAVEQPELDGTSWELSALPGRDIDLDVPVTLSFEDGQISGNAGCNDYGSPYSSAADGTISFEEIHQTDMDCETGMDVEGEYLQALFMVERYAVDDTRLELQDADGNTLLVFMQDDAATNELTGTVWTLDSLAGEAVPDSFEPITLHFSSDGSAGGTVCNTYGGTYEIEADGVLRIADVFSTEMYCTEPDGLMDLEMDYFAALDDVAGYQIDDDQLTLTDDNGEVLMTLSLRERSDAGPLDGTSWAVVSIDGQPLIDGTEVTVEFDEGRATGNGGCNGYGAEYTAGEDGTIDIHDGVMTLMACMEPEGVMDQETAFHTALQEVTAWEQDGDDLRLLDDAGEVRLMLVNTFNPDEPVTDEPTGLKGSNWFLTALDGQPVESMAPYTLQFSVNGPTGKAGCMTWWMQFIMEHDGTITHETRVSPSTHDAFCDGDEAAIAEAEAYVEALSNAASYESNEEHMQLLDADGTIILEFERGLDGGELEGTSWMLAAMNGDTLVDGTEITLEFDAEHATGSGGCNGYGGPYMVVEQGTVAIVDVARTEIGCVEPDGVMEQETAYFDTLIRVVGYEMNDDSLTLLDVNGETILEFAPAS